MAMPVITWQEMMEMEEGPDPVVDMFAEWIRIEDERDARMKMGVVEEKLSDEGSEEEEKLSEGSEVEIEGEEMDFEKAVETRVRKRCDLRMDEEAMRKVKKIAWDVNSLMRYPRIDAKEMMQKKNIDTEALRAFLNLDFVLGGSKQGTNPVKDALQEACRWMAEEIVKNSTRVMAEASGDSKVEKLLANSAFISEDKGKAPAFPEERYMEPKDKAVAFPAESARETDPEDEAASLKSLSDFNENNAREYRDFWIEMFSHRFGSYEDTTSIPAMRFTQTGRAPFVRTNETLQIFSVKVAGIREGLQWPLDIYGMVAIRDVVDHNRNIIFDRKRDNCQTITEEDPYLALTGPSRAVMLSVHTSTLEAVLKLKGDTESDDKEFSFLITSYRHFAPCYSIMRDRRVPSKLSTLEMTVGYIICSVEATISVKLIDGSWPDGFRGKFTARTASIDDKEILLLAFGEDKLPLGDGKKIELSRCVVSVEHPRYRGQLKVSAQAVRGTEEKDVLKGELDFTPQEAGQSEQKFKVGSCEMEVTVAWSLLSSFPEL